MQATPKSKRKTASDVDPAIRRSDCPISSVLDLIGDKWSLLIIRDLLLGKKRFGEFMQSPEAITSSILTTRLKWLQTCEFIEAQQYETKPPRYEYQLTAKGQSLRPLIQEAARWGHRFLPNTWKPPASFLA